MNPIELVAKNEFAMIARNPIVPVFVGFLTILVLVNAAGYTLMDDMYSQAYDHDTTFYIGIANLITPISMSFAFLAMCTGAISIAEERSKGSLRILLTKPLYRRDIIIGKFLGIGAFFVLIITLTIIIFVSIEMAFFGCPASLSELAIKLSTFIFMLLLHTSFTFGLVMLFGILLDKREALVLSVAYLAYEWLFQLATITAAMTSIPALKFIGLIDPIQLYWWAYMARGTPSTELLAAARPYFAWLQDSYPFLILMILEVIIIILVDCASFSREEA